jgi:homoserine O-acetyltransferase
VAATGLKANAGSVGVVDTQVLTLPQSLKLDCGRELRHVEVAYETYGQLSPAKDNVILVCHALSGDAHAAGIAKRQAALRRGTSSISRG